MFHCKTQRSTSDHAHCPVVCPPHFSPPFLVLIWSSASIYHLRFVRWALGETVNVRSGSVLALVYLLYRNQSFPVSLFFLFLLLIPWLMEFAMKFPIWVSQEVILCDREPVDDVSGGSCSSFSFNGAARAFSLSETLSETPLTITQHWGTSAVPQNRSVSSVNVMRCN